MPDAFLDTNVVICALTADPTRANRAEALIRAGAIISVQVLNECANTLRRKFNADWVKVGDASRLLRAACDVVAVTEPVHAAALEIAVRHRIEMYDATIIAAAQLSGCTTLWSEDMHHGLVIDGRTIRNPFL